MEKITYKELYSLQDEVLKYINSLKHEFYLTGGTALNRFLIRENTRYSDDLDFFISTKNKEINAENEMVGIINSLQEKYKNVKIESDFKDFKRIVISKQNINLQVDFVNDLVNRFGKSEIHNNTTTDNLLNILTNKISAIMSRDEEKDIYDLYLISKNFNFNWEKIIQLAQEKEHFQSVDFACRLKSFPISLLDNIKTNNKNFIYEIKKKMQILINEVENGLQNGLFIQKDNLFSSKNLSKLRENVARLSNNIGNLPFILEKAIENEDVDGLKKIIEHIKKSDTIKDRLNVGSTPVKISLK